MLVGNSIGSLATLMVADAAPPGQVAGLALLNCAGGMNNKAIRWGRRSPLCQLFPSGLREACVALLAGIRVHAPDVPLAGLLQTWQALPAFLSALAHHPLPPPFMFSCPPQATPGPCCSDDWRIKLAMPIFLLIDLLLQRRPLAERLFNNFRTPDNIRSVLLVRRKHG